MHDPTRVQQHQWATGPLPCTYDFSSSSKIKVFDVMFINGEEAQHTVMVYVNQILAYFGKEGCLDAIERDGPIKVASAGVSAEAYDREFEEEAIAGARAAWTILINPHHVPHHSEPHHRSRFP